jgi:hypothetical protein
MKFFAFVVSSAAVASANGFTVSQAFSRSLFKTALPSTEVLSDVDIMCLMNTADYCVETHCPVSTNDALLNTLAGQEELLCDRVTKLDMIMDELTGDKTAIRFDANTKALLNDIDLMCVMNVAAYCKEEGCDLEDTEALMYTLALQRQAASSTVVDLEQNMLTLIKSERADSGRNLESLPATLQNTLRKEELARP